MLRKEGSGKKRVDGKLCGTAHKGCKQNRHFTIPFRGERPAGHDAGYRAPEPDQHRHDTAAGQADFPQKLIHDEGHSRHIAAVFQNREEEEQCDNDRQKAEHTAHTRKNSVHNERLQCSVHMACCQRRVGDIRQPGYSHIQQIGKPCTDHIEGQPEYKPHNCDKYRDCRIFSGKDPVYPCASGMLPALLRLNHRLPANLLDKMKPHIRDGRRPVQTALQFHLTNDMFQHLFFIILQFKGFQNHLITLRQLGSRETERNTRALRMILNQMHDSVDTSMYCASFIIRTAEIHLSGTFLIFRQMQGMVNQLIDPFVFCRGDRNHRHPQQFFHFIDSDGTAILPHLIHHIQRDHHRNIQLHQLHRQVQIPFNIGRIHDIDNSLRFFPQDKFPCHHFLTAVRGHGINTRQIGDQCVGMSLNRTVLPIHGDTREITHMLVRSRKPVKQRCLSAVLISR